VSRHDAQPDSFAVKKKSNTGHFLFLGIVIGFCLFVGLAIAAFIIWGWGLFTEQVTASLNANPVIQEKIGTIASVDTDFTATGNADGEETFVFHIEGEKGRGTVTAEFVSNGASEEELRSGTLTMSTGESFDLLAVPAEPEITETADVSSQSDPASAKKSPDGVQTPGQ
jgi:hypothetical protein